MKPMFNAIWLAAARVAAPFLVGVLVSGPATAQGRPDDWQFRAIIYGYLPDIGGTTTFPAGGGSSINVDADTIISNLKFTFMGSIEAQKGRWGAFTDILYLDVGGSKSDTRDLTIGGVQLPAGVTANASLDIKGTVWTLAGNYRVLATPEATFDVFAGARLLSIKQAWAGSSAPTSVRSWALVAKGTARSSSTIGMASLAPRGDLASARDTSGSCRITSTSGPAILI